MPGAGGVGARTFQGVDLREAGDGPRDGLHAVGQDVQGQQRKGLRGVALGGARSLDLAHVLAPAQVLDHGAHPLQRAGPWSITMDPIGPLQQR